MNVIVRPWLIVGALSLCGVMACDGDKGTSGNDSDDAASQEDSSTPSSTSGSAGTSGSTATSETTTSANSTSGDSTSTQGSECAMAMTTGTAVGDIVPDISLLGQDGNMHSLREVCESIVYVVSGAMWCPSCLAHADTLRGIKDKYPSKNLVVYNLMSETGDGLGMVPEQKDLAAWAEKRNFGPGMWALADAGLEAFKVLYPGNTSYMGEMVIEAGGKIACTDVEGGCVDVLEKILSQ